MPRLKHYPDKTCEQCGSVFTRHKSPNGRLEGAEDYLPRRFCSSSCYTQWHRGTNHYLYNEEGSSRYDGYVRVTRNGRRVYLHRWLMEQHLGRPLRLDEHVHHDDENPKNNAFDNLILTTNSNHLKMHYQHWKAVGRINEKGQFS